MNCTVARLISVFVFNVENIMCTIIRVAIFVHICVKMMEYTYGNVKKPGNSDYNRTWVILQRNDFKNFN